MAYNSGFPVGYQPAQIYYPYPYQGQNVPVQNVAVPNVSVPSVPVQNTPVQQSPQQNPNNTISWVNNEEEAKAYLVAPNSAVALWDANKPVLYLKKADSSGKPSFQAYDLVERTETAAEARSDAKNEYASMKEIEALWGQIDNLKMRIGKLCKTDKKGVTDSE